MSPPGCDPDPMDGPWPRVTVVTPSFNQGEFVEETIRSVLLQGFPGLEYIVIDGGSTDNSVEIIRKYEPWLSYWVSEKDRGQAHAVNKGFQRSTGDLLGWLNSDDVLESDALSRIARASRQTPDAILLGDVVYITAAGDPVQIVKQRNVTLRNMVEAWNPDRRVTWQQPGTYVPRRHYDQVGGLDESLRYIFDLDWMCRILRTATVSYLGVPVARFRMHQNSKTFGEVANWLPEYFCLADRYLNDIPTVDQPRALADLELVAARQYLSVRFWDRRKALRHLMGAVRDDRQVFRNPSNLILWIRAAAPIQLLRILRGIRNAGRSNGF